MYVPFFENEDKFCKHIAKLRVNHFIGDETIHTPIQIKPSRISIVFANFFSLSDVCSSTKALEANKRQSQRMDFNQWGSCACVKNILLWGFAFKILFHSQPRCYCGRAIVCTTLKVIFSIHLGSPLLRIRLFLFCGFLLLRYLKISCLVYVPIKSFSSGHHSKCYREREID